MATFSIFDFDDPKIGVALNCASDIGIYVVFCNRFCSRLAAPYAVPFNGIAWNQSPGMSIKSVYFKDHGARGFIALVDHGGERASSLASSDQGFDPELRFDARLHSLRYTCLCRKQPTS